MPAIYNLHQLSKVQPTYQTGQICSCSRHIAFYPFTTLNKSYVKKGGEGGICRQSAASSFGMCFGLQVAFFHLLGNLALSLSCLPIFKLKTTKISCERGVCCCTYTEQPGKFSFLHTCDLASSSYIFLLSSSFCFPAEQLRQF